MYVKPSTIPHRAGKGAHESAILSAIKDYSDKGAYISNSKLFALLSADTAWLGNSKQSVKTVLNGQLYRLRKNGAIATGPKVALTEQLKELTVDVTEKMRLLKAARVEARKAKASEYYKKNKLAQEALLQEANARADEANARALSAEARADEAFTGLTEANARLADSENNASEVCSLLENNAANANAFALLLTTISLTGIGAYLALNIQLD